jgi:S-adenosylmethionine:tRNA ribosyltransferase-isomerase
VGLADRSAGKGKAAAFAGRELIFKAYNEAIAQKYRFYSFGDAMLII